MLNINPNWTLKEFSSNLRTLKNQYCGILASFSSWETKEKSDFIRKTRDQFYSFNFKEWVIDRFWNYMNGFDSLCKIQIAISRFK